ncbi:uncharacterized protein LOC111320634 [Stylophora pistillata]|uniref:uncharacterized protein LOC111320634 n=1 Tax=Stylophora pistillata TaxID=50429 RepID=UPI000C044887|nr:uncharacterized protein LOC111320634 [Stylophora pistillata]XP_022779019.1 uncharacterized protein LOC111320634 [Stylophora pistillata]
MNYNVLLGAMIMTVLSLVASTTRLSSAKVIVKAVLLPRQTNATKQMLKLYPWIDNNWDLKETELYLVEEITQLCSDNTTRKDNLSIAYTKLSTFVFPLSLAYSYEETKGNQHSLLAKVLKDTSHWLNSTYLAIYHNVSGLPLLPPQQKTERELDDYTRVFLNALVNSNHVSLTITDDVVKTYRNYAILYTLKDVIVDVLSCLI